MATVRQPKPTSPAKYDAYVEEQLNKARRRIRLLDVSSALLILVAATFVYILAVGLLDRKLELSPAVRQATFLGFAVAVLAFLGWAVLRPLFRRVNPYFAARAIEQVVPGAKNSVVNWLDLHDETLPPAIRASLSQRTAKDLGQADLEQAISGRRAVWLTGIAALLAFVLFGLLVTSGLASLGTLLTRIFAPFGTGAHAQRTQLTLVRPAEGNTNLGLGQSFEVAVCVDGHVPSPEAPDALKLLFRNGDDDSFEEQTFSQENGDVWMTVLPSSRIYGNFSYKIKGGDAETPEYRVTIRSTPQVEHFDVTYHHRAYTGWPDNFTHDGNLNDLRGTEVEMLLRTNRPVKEGHLEVETSGGKRNIDAKLVPDNPKAMRFHYTLEQDGHYFVRFTTTDNDTNVGALPYTIKVKADEPPSVKLLKPAADVTLPANGTLGLEGEVNDDIGIKEVTLRLRFADGPMLQSKPYRDGKSLQLGSHGYPKKLDPAYQDFVALDQIKDDKGKLFPLSKGMVLEYWLEAADACDYPAPHRAESQHFKVNIIDPANQQQQQQERDQAAAEQKKHDKEEDQKRKEEEKKRQQEAEQKQEQQKPGKGDKSEGNQGAGQPAQSSQQPKPNDQGSRSPEQAVENQLNGEQKKDQRDRGKGGAKGPSDGKGEGKDEGKDDKGDAKPQGQPSDKPEGGTKDDGKTPQGQDANQGGAKSEGNKSPDNQAGDAKSKGPDDAQGAGSQKPDVSAKSGKADAKDQGKGEDGSGAAVAKEQTPGKSDDKEGGAKGAGSDSGDAKDKATAKGEQSSQAHGENKTAQNPMGAEGGTKGEGQDKTAQAESKSGGSKNDGGGPAQAGAAKDDPSKRDLASAMKQWDEQVRKGTEKESADAERDLEKLAQNAQDKDVRDLAQKVLEKARSERSSAPSLPRGPIDTSKGPSSEAKGQGAAKDAGSAKGGNPDGMTAKGSGNSDPKGVGRGGYNEPGSSITPADQPKLAGFSAVETEPLPANPAHRRWAGNMQIEDFRSIDREAVLKYLKEHNITPEQWNAYARRRAAEMEQLPDSQQDRIGNRAARTVETQKGKAEGDKTGLGELPPEFRALYNDYTRRQSEKK